MSRESTAWHEAGHLAAGILVGAKIAPEGADIRQVHWQNGQAHVYTPLDETAIREAWWTVTAGGQVDPVTRDAIERACYVSLAGYPTEAVAEQRGFIAPVPVIDSAAPAHRTRWLAAINSAEPKPTGDSEAVDELLAWLCTRADEQSAYRRVLELRTDWMVRSNPRFWPLAQAFAAALLDHDEISGADITALAAQVEGGQPV